MVPWRLCWTTAGLQKKSFFRISRALSWRRRSPSAFERLSRRMKNMKNWKSEHQRFPRVALPQTGSAIESWWACEACESCQQRRSDSFGYLICFSTRRCKSSFWDFCFKLFQVPGPNQRDHAKTGSLRSVVLLRLVLDMTAPPGCGIVADWCRLHHFSLSILFALRVSGKHATSQPADWRQRSDVKPYEFGVRNDGTKSGFFCLWCFFAGFCFIKSHADDSEYSNFCLNLEALTHVPKGRAVQHFLPYFGRHLIWGLGQS